MTSKGVLNFFSLVEKFHHLKKIKFHVAGALVESDSNFVHISKGFANGSMSLEANSELLIFSNSSIKESLKDDIRYDAEYWNPWIISSR